MKDKNTAYKYKKSQVCTPPKVVNLFWDLTHKYRTNFKRVLDMGAGDGRFAFGGKYAKYEGIEIDKNYLNDTKLPKNATLRYGCVFEHQGKNYDACIGNPPYYKQNNINPRRRDEIAEKLEQKFEIQINRHCNLFVYFLWLGIIKAKPDGLISLIVPYEWVYRPSVESLRNYIKKQNWSVNIYRFKETIFDDVETTASITIIDKSKKSKKWKFYNIDKNFNVKKQKNILSSNNPILKHESRGDIWALRGLSPGTQKVFTLTEDERIDNGLHLHDVYYCVTSFMKVPKEAKILNKKAFRKYFIDAGHKCWLICSDKKLLSDSLKRYLNNISKKDRNTSTCKERKPWYAYVCHPKPQILYASGFTNHGPKVIINSIGAIAVGSIHGIHSNKEIKKYDLRDYLTKVNFESRVVPYSGSLKKIEVRQMNSILNKYLKENGKNDRKFNN